MKLESSIVICKGFALCRGHMTPGDSYSYTKDDTTQDARFSQVFYLVEGGGIMYDGIGREHGRSDASDVWDFREYYGKSYRFLAGTSGATWLCVNPLPSNKFFNVELIRENNNKTIVGDGAEHIILCAKGNLTINDKSLSQFNYSRILNGKTAEVNVPAGSEALYLSR